MAHEAGSITTNPRTGSTWTLIEGEGETEGRGFVVEVACLPGAGPDIMEHFHQHWTETFEIVEGHARYRLDGTEHGAATGATIVLPPGQPHVHPWAVGTDRLVYRQTTVFATPDARAVRDTLGVFFFLFALAREGKVDARGLPRNPLQLAATLKALVRHGGYDAAVPVFAQKVLASTVGGLAELLGYSAAGMPDRSDKPARPR